MCAVKVGLVLGLSAWLGACATAPQFSENPACMPATDTTARLKVQYDGRAEHLLLRTERNGPETVFVALDTIGSPQFTASLSAGRLALERSPLYQGAEPAVLLWGYNWWRLRAAPLRDCARSAGLQLQQTSTSISLSHNGRPVWYWDSAHPQQYDLPQQRSRVNVTTLER